MQRLTDAYAKDFSLFMLHGGRVCSLSTIVILLKINLFYLLIELLNQSP